MLDDELRALVSVDPSPDFQARVRIEIAAKASRAFWLRSPLSALAMSAAVVVALLVGFWPQTIPLDSEIPTVVPLPEGSHGSLTSLAAGRLTPLAVSVPAQRPTISRPTDIVRSSDESPVAFDRAEMLALQRLFASSRAETVSDATTPSDGPLVFPDIVIAPLTVDAPDKGASR